jgi:hypothetical protein
MAGDRDRLEKLLGMLGSSFDGERANAGGFIQKMAEKRKQTVVEMVRDVLGVVERPKPRPQPQQDPYDDFWDQMARKQRESARTTNRNHPGRGLLGKLWEKRESEHLSDWDRDFIYDICDRYFGEDDLTRKQREQAERILRRVEKWERRKASEDIL